MSERSRAVGFVFSGFNVGSVLGLVVAPLVIEATNWRTVFAFFGTCGLTWSAWSLKMYGNGGMVEESYRDDGVTGMTGKRVFTVDAKAIARGETPAEDPPVPWESLFRIRRCARSCTCTFAKTGILRLARLVTDVLHR